MTTITEVLSSPESALLLSSIYDFSTGLSNPNKDELLGPVLYREGEDLVSCSRMDNLVKIYHRFDIGKFFRISLIEFTNMTSWEVNLLVENAEVFMKELSEDMSEIEDSVGKKKENMLNDGLTTIMGDD